MRIIDADRLYRGLCDWQYGAFSTKGCETEYAILESVLDGVLRQPTIDAVPVVRCKDCKYRWHYIDNRGNEVYKCEVEMDLCDPYEIGRKPYDDDWFCADGERRDNNGI